MRPAYLTLLHLTLAILLRLTLAKPLTGSGMVDLSDLEQETGEPQIQRASDSAHGPLATARSTSNNCSCAALMPFVIKISLEGHPNAKYDHRDYVVSDLEFELVLRRLREEADATTTTPEPVPTGAEGQLESSRELRPNASLELDSSRECFICLEEFAASPSEDQANHLSAPDSTGLVLYCRHKFHRHCIEAWLGTGQKTAKRCPICKHLLRLADGSPLKLPEGADKK